MAVFAWINAQPSLQKICLPRMICRPSLNPAQSVTVVVGVVVAVVVGVVVAVVVGVVVAVVVGVVVHPQFSDKPPTCVKIFESFKALSLTVGYSEINSTPPQ